MLPSTLSGVPTAVLGYGISGKALVRRLLFEGAKVTVYGHPGDHPPCPLRLLGSPIQAEVVFRSPGIRPDKIPLPPGAILSSETELFFARHKGKVLGVTGSGGKTTTATLTAKMLEKAGYRVFLGGNIGVSLLDFLPEMTEDSFSVLELSSFQLFDYSPPLDAGCFTGISENHLNWHRDMAEYREAKSHIFQHAKRCVIHPGDRYFDALPLRNPLYYGRDFPGKTPSFFIKDGMIIRHDTRDLPLFPVAVLARQEPDFQENFLAAMALTFPYVPLSSMQEVGKTFPGVPHRMEKLGEKEGVVFYNSSADTTPTRTLHTLMSCKKPPVVILGGSSKNLSFAPFRGLSGKVLAVVAVGENPELTQNLPENLPVYPVEDWQKAFCTGFQVAKKLETDLLLSPGCASFDAFSHFEERGEAFRHFYEKI